MVEEAVVLVIVQYQDRATPDLGVGGERFQHARRVVSALRRTRLTGMLRVQFAGNNPTDLRQRIGQHVGLELLKISGAASARLELFRRTGHTCISVAKHLEERQRVVVVVVLDVLIDLPADAASLQPLRVRGPAVAVTPALRCKCGNVIEGGRPATLRMRIVAAGPQKQAVRCRATLEGTVIGVAQRECIGQRVMKR